ncbi:MAG: class I SAM-dependent methyltransferase [Candidatus Babeliales bacterium]|nr:class I SAM-dependent methyltransferase [Candidatus Babeliales bacterium]
MNFKLIFICLIVMLKVFALPEPYASIVPLAADYHGGVHPTNQAYLSNFIKKLNPTTVIEVGTWLGVTAFLIAKQLGKQSKLYVVDPWEDYEEMHAFPEYQKRMPTSYWQFLSNCIHMKLTHKIIPIKMKSIQASKALNINADLIFIDACHTEEDVYQDIMAWYPKVKKGGICCGDDWWWPSVKKGVARAIAELKLEVYSEDNFWYFEPKK